LKGISLSAVNADKQIIGNKKSNIYHLPNDCPSYDKVARINQVPFSSQMKLNGLQQIGRKLPMK